MLYLCMNFVNVSSFSTSLFAWKGFFYKHRSANVSNKCFSDFASIFHVADSLSLISLCLLKLLICMRIGQNNSVPSLGIEAIFHCL